MFERIVKSKLALKGMTLKDLAEAIDESYNSVYDVVHEKWGKKRGEVAQRILEKLSKYLGVTVKETPELPYVPHSTSHKKEENRKKKRRLGGKQR